MRIVLGFGVFFGQNVFFLGHKGLGFINLRANLLDHCYFFGPYTIGLFHFEPILRSLFGHTIR